MQYRAVLGDEALASQACADLVGDGVVADGSPTREEIRRARKEMQASRIKAGDRIQPEKVLAKMKKLRGA